MRTKASKIILQRKWGKLWPYFFPDNSWQNLYKKHLMFQRHAVCTKKSRLNPREHTLLLTGTLCNRFWRPSSQSSFFPLHSVTEGTAKSMQKIRPHTWAPTCLSSHHSCFYSIGGILCSLWKPGSTNRLKTNIACTIPILGVQKTNPKKARNTP